MGLEKRMRTLAPLMALLGAGASSAMTYSVGPARTYTSVCNLVSQVSLQPGDVIQVDAATYTDACQLTASGTQAQSILLQGVPGTLPVFDASSLDLSGSGQIPRAIFQFTGGSFWTVEHLELKNAHNASMNGAAFRATAGSHDIVIRDVSVHDNQDGMMSDGIATVTIESSDIYANGAGDGFSHNFYMQGDETQLIGNHIHDSNGGQNVKIRSRYAVLLYNRIERAGNYEIDLIQGPLTGNANANAVMIGNVVIRPASSGNNSQVILFGADGLLPDGGLDGRNGSLWAANNTFIMANASNHLLHANFTVSGSQIFLDNNIITSTVAGSAVATDANTLGLIQGSSNWINTNISDVASLTGLTGTLTGNDPGFVAGGDHLAAASPCIGQGVSGATYEDGTGTQQSATPTFEFSPPQGTVCRVADSHLDIGADEYSDGGECSDGGGTPVDAGGASDSGTSLDAGSDGGSSPKTIAGSCGCSSSGPSAVGVALLALLAFSTRRRLSVTCGPTDRR